MESLCLGFEFLKPEVPIEHPGSSLIIFEWIRLQSWITFNKKY